MSFFKKILNTVPRPILIQLSRLARPVLDIFYRGNTYYDPINEKGYRKFLPYGYVNIRTQVLSPGTLSLERHRLMWLYLKNETDFFRTPSKVLHIAPEQAFYKRLKKMNNLEYLTADLYSPLAEVKADITHLPFENNSFDVIFCNHVLEHVKDDYSAIQEMFRVMKSGGFGIFQVPLDSNRTITFEDDSITNAEERTKIFGQYDHLRIYGMDYFDKLAQAGFVVKTMAVKQQFSEKEIEKYRLDRNEILPVVFKSRITNGYEFKVES